MPLHSKSELTTNPSKKIVLKEIKSCIFWWNIFFVAVGQKIPDCLRFRTAFASVHDASALMVSKLPNLKCWMTGNFSRQSALYIRISPWLTLDHAGTALIFHSWLECSANGPVFISLINLMHSRNMYSLWCSFTIFSSTKCTGVRVG